MSPALHFRQPWEGNSNRAKLGREQGTKQPIPPTFIKNWLIPRTFWGSTYKNTPFGFCGCSHKVDNKTENLKKCFPEAFIWISHETAVVWNLFAGGGGGGGGGGFSCSECRELNWTGENKRTGFVGEVLGWRMEGKWRAPWKYKLNSGIFWEVKVKKSWYISLNQTKFQQNQK